MDSDSASVDIEDYEIWEPRRARLRALELVNRNPHQAEFKIRMSQQLRAAVGKGDVDKFIEALEKYPAEEGVSLSNILGPSGSSLLHVAAGIMEADILRALLEVVHDEQLVTKVNFRGDTALHVAARAGSIRTTELLLGYPSILDTANDVGNTALHEAVKNGNYALTDLLLRRGSKSVNKKNEESKCPLYLAVEKGNLQILKLLMEAVGRHEDFPSQTEGMSPVHGAVLHERIGMLKEMSEWNEGLFNLRDAEGGTPLHLAASMDYVEGVDFLVKNFAWSAFEFDKEGYLPIHVACKMDSDRTIKKLLQHWPNPEELLDLNEGQNILHVAAKYGSHRTTACIVLMPKLKKLINAKDKKGNTPLHAAAFKLQSFTLLSLVQVDVVDLKLVNNNNLTAIDIADEQLKKIDAPRELFRLAAVRILEAAKAPRSKEKATYGLKVSDPGTDEERPYIKKLKNVANHRMFVATLVATMTFAAGFSVPGGYNGSEPDVGIATLLNKPMYDVFVICNTVAMYSSIMAAVILLLGQIATDSHTVLDAIEKTRLPLLIALATMSMAFMAGVYVTTNKRTWVADVALIIGIVGLFHTVKVHCYFFLWILFDLLILMVPLQRWLSRRRWLSFVGEKSH